MFKRCEPSSSLFIELYSENKAPYKLSKLALIYQETPTDTKYFEVLSVDDFLKKLDIGMEGKI